MLKTNGCILLLVLLLVVLQSALGLYKIGVGIADCTGPSAEIVFMGYGKPSQKGCGIHLRQFARAFIFDDGIKRAVFVSVDAAMISYGVLNAVLTNLGTLYGNTYTTANIILSGTHTHSVPGGFLMDFLYDLPCFGFVGETFDALVAGIVRSIVRAHDNVVDGKIYVSSGQLLGVNINRSPSSYLLNPEEERAKYLYNVDKQMVQLKLLKAQDDSLIGAINWFPVHGTSMNFTNCLISSDNSGFASVLLEKRMNGNLPIGKGPFVGAFASTNLGDSSPNVKGARCTTTGGSCDTVSSTCDGQARFCVASGPGEDMFQSTKIIGEKLFEKAQILLESTESKEVTGPIKYIHRFVDMPLQTADVKLPNGTVQRVHGCLPAMGYSFAAGTTEGVGEFDFKQGTQSTSYWEIVTALISKPTEKDVACHHPKPILFNTGRMFVPYQWQPRIMPTQVIRIGQLFLTAVPGEFTTMSGRRLKDIVKDAAINHGGPVNSTVIVTGLSNTYSSYITTPQEYQLQRYEGASTIFGPHTLTLYLAVYKQLTEFLFEDGPLTSGPLPPDFSGRLISVVPPVIFDTSGLLHNFGDCVGQPPLRINRGTTVAAIFIAGHPRNDPKQESTFLTVEKLISSENWRIVATDADWETKFMWRRTSTLLGASEAIIEWEISSNTPQGTYRIRHFGDHKDLFGNIKSYSGATRNFQVDP